MATLEDLLRTAEGHLVVGQFPEAKAAVDEAFAIDPDDARLGELYQNVYLAHGIRLSGLARETRRREIEERGKPGEAFADSEEVTSLFREMVAAFDRVLAVNPRNVKALSLKAQAFYRMDRGNRAQALVVYDEAMAALEETNPSDSAARETGRRNLLHARRRIEKPCEWCDDTGFCTECGGSGLRTVLRFRKRCETCLGHGICRRCGVL